MAQATAKQRRVRGVNSSIDDLLLKGKPFRSHVSNRLVAEPVMTRSIEGASSIPIVISDPLLELLGSPMLERKIDVELDGLWFRLAGVGKSGDDVTLTFEDRLVSYLRGYRGPVKAYRDKVTRAEFILARIREVREEHIRTFIKELHKVQPIANDKQAQVQKEKDRERRGKGIDESADLTVKGVDADSEQIKNADTALRTAEHDGATEIAKVALIAAMIAESLIRNLGGGDGTSRGTLQVISTTAASAGVNPMDVAEVCHVFLVSGYTGSGGAIRLSKTISDPAVVAATVQGNAAGAASYRPFVEEAKRWVEAFDGGSLSSGSITVEEDKRFAFEIGPKETYWDGTGRLAEEVQSRRFASAGIFHYGSEKDFADAAPLMYIHRRSDGIDNVDFTYDVGLPVTEVSIVGRAKAWSCPPGTVAVLGKEYGPAAGRYIVSEVTSGLMSSDFNATLKTPMRELPEPAPETTSKTVSFGESGDAGSSGGASDLSGVKVNTSMGAPHWGGSADVMHQLVDKIMQSHGMSAGGTKEGGHTPGGDHDPAVTNAFATDYTPATNGEEAAREVAKALGDESIVHTYRTAQFEVDGVSFRVQVLWELTSAQPGPGDYAHRAHVHVGIRRL